MSFMSASLRQSVLAFWLLVAVALLPGCGTSRTKSAAPSTPAEGASPPPVSPPRYWKPIGSSVEHRPLLVSDSGSGPLRIYLIGGIHGDETEGRTAVDLVKNAPNAAATIRILRDLNPDGTAVRRRSNASGLDLNRNWPARNFNPGSDGGFAPLSEPETRALDEDLRRFKPDIVVVLHSISFGPLVNYDGPAEHLASAFAAAAQSVNPDWYVRADMGYDTAGSLGSYLGVDRQLPILTIEFQRGQDEAGATTALQKGLAAVIRAARASHP
jgi:protein MpaA